MQTESSPRRATIFTLALICSCVILTSATPARAQDMRVDRLEIIEFGFFDSAQVKVTSAKEAEGSVTGMVQQLGALRMLPEPPANSARIGIGFGVRFRSFGERNGERAMLRSVWKIPEPGIVNPTNHTTWRESAADFPTVIGTSHWRGYGFDHPWEIVPGTWTLEIWQGDRKLLEKSFEITKGE